MWRSDQNLQDPTNSYDYTKDLHRTTMKTKVLVACHIGAKYELTFFNLGLMYIDLHLCNMYNEAQLNTATADFEDGTTHSDS